MTTLYTANSNLYKWQSSDTKQTTITEMSSTMDKIDTSLKDNSNKTDWFLSLSMYNVVGDGVVDDTAAFTTIETNYTNKVVDMGGKTYKVTSLPTKNNYVNGTFYYNSSYLDASYARNIRANHGVIALGLHAAENAPVFPSYTGSLFYKNIAIGGYAMQNSVANYNNIAIGHEALRNANNGEYYNLAIGGVALWNTKKDNDGDKFTATRNAAIGSNSMYFNVKGSQNAAFGRNTLQCTQNGVQNVVLGVNAMAGDAPLNLNGMIANYSQSDASNNTAIGYNSLAYNVANNNTAVGSDTAENVTKASTLTALGRNALNQLQKDMTKDGTNKYYASKSGTYSWNGTTITVTMTTHGFTTGWTVSLGLTSGTSYTEENHYTVTVIDANTFTVVAPASGSTSGNCTSSWYSDNTTNTKVSDNNVAIGAYAMENVISGTNNVAVGTWANRNNSGSDMNTMIGNLAGTNLTSGGTNTALGYGAMRYNIDGTNATNITGSTALGYNSRVSGNNQIQLGYSGTTTYAYGAVQDRSDQRDKADIETTPLGLDFINKIRPVQFRWNMRDDYIQVNEETGEVIHLPNDGSKKRQRLHQGVIAQEVKQVMDEIGVDFGGFQDHTVNGGSDILTIGYEEFIAPLIKAVQELSTRVKELENKVNE